MKDIITIENLRTAIRMCLDASVPKDDEWIGQIASFIMDFFGFEERILDNRLTPRDRDIFYMLEGMGLLKTEMEEATIQKGKVWRIHYWILNKERIENLLNIKPTEGQDASDIISEGEVYENLSEKAWNRNN